MHLPFLLEAASHRIDEKTVEAKERAEVSYGEPRECHLITCRGKCLRQTARREDGPWLHSRSRCPLALGQI